MTVFRKSVSWSKFDLAIKCPLALQNTIDKKFSALWGIPTKASAMGKLVQKVFEVYFNLGLNLAPNGQRVEVLFKVLDKVLADPWCQKEGVDPSMREAALPQIQFGFEQFATQKILSYPIASEVKARGAYMGFPMFGMVDFVATMPGGLLVYDGKGHAKKNADPRQVLYYGLIFHAAKQRVMGGGFLYWKHGFEPIQLDPRTLHAFVQSEDFKRALGVFAQLRQGVDVLPATPSKNSCYYCPWRKTCEFSASRKQVGEVFEGVQSIGFGEEIHGSDDGGEVPKSAGSGADLGEPAAVLAGEEGAT